MNASMGTALHLLLLISLMSCASAAERLVPPRHNAEVRLSDIEKLVNSDSEMALHRIAEFQLRYGDSPALAPLREKALATLSSAAEKARSDRNWFVAASYERSLLALDPARTALSSAHFSLEEAKDHLKAGDDLAAFLCAAQASMEKPLSREDALLFLDASVKARQRRTAAFFLAAAESAGATIPSEARTWATGRDSPTEMIKGVATVWVDRGIKVTKGVGYPDRIIGSAFFVSSRGLLVTNCHVIESLVDPKVEGYARLYIRMGDSSSPRIPAKVIGWDETMDLALIKAEFEPEYVFSLLDRVHLRVGEQVLAIGSPAGLEKTVTSGIVSAIGRRLLPLGDVVQIDAAVNHGNSGGPVVDTEGRLAGVVFAGIESYQGLNFAVPADRLAQTLPLLLRGGSVKRPWLGLALHEDGKRLSIVYIAPGTAASDQMVGEGLFLTSIDGVVVDETDRAKIITLQDSISSRRTGELIRIGLSDGSTRVLALGERPKNPLAEASRIDSRERLVAPLYGFVLAASGSGPLSTTPDYLVTKVYRGSVADEAGLSENDPVSLKGFSVLEDEGVALLDIYVKKRRMGYLETQIRLPALLQSSDLL